MPRMARWLFAHNCATWEEELDWEATCKIKQRLRALDGPGGGL
jgi:hypothetical protein